MTSDLRVTYDDQSDVLYVRFYPGPATQGVEDANGLVWRYGLSGKLLGVTILDFAEIWGHRLDDLAAEIGSHSTNDSFVEGTLICAMSDSLGSSHIQDHSQHF